ncbi:hypothetical protein SAMN05446935_10016, partial [Burkholderia sp. YR290]
VGARSKALVSIENYHEAIPYLQTAESLIVQLNGHPDGQAEARGELLDRLDELIDAAVGMIDLAEQCFGDAQATDPDAVPPSILDAPLHPDA